MTICPEKKCQLIHLNSHVIELLLKAFTKVTNEVSVTFNCIDLVTVDRVLHTVIMKDIFS